MFANNYNNINASFTFIWLFTRKNIYIPNEWMKDVEIVAKVNQFIQNLELSVMDNKRKDLVTIIHDEMNSKLTQRKGVHKNGLNNKRRKMKKPWWNDNLTELWN